jgi:hypothetical protein
LEPKLASHEYDVDNPALTRLGHKQAEYLQTAFEPMNRITHILCSPLKRTLQTCVLGFKPLLKEGLRVVCWSDLRGSSRHPFNRAEPFKTLEYFINDNPVDISLLEGKLEMIEDERYERGSTVRAADVEEALRNLGTVALKDPGLRSKEDREMLARFGTRQSHVNNVEIAVVTHSSFVAKLAGNWDNGNIHPRKFSN